MIELSVNNETTQIAEHTPLQNALHQWGYGETKIAVAINGEFVPRARYAEQLLLAGDQLDIVKPIGGG